MKLKDIFIKPVDRPIEGVIKADDEASLRLEIEEYVLTNEIEKRLEKFLDAYINYDNANGVWISGFFGSGKSHLLKMLALVLENRQIDGVATLDLLLPKCEHNEILRGDLKRAVSIPSKSILFNIDQKADVISKKEMDALLAVFVKVFDETCGYYGKQGHIAQFERDLDSRNQYSDFKKAYEDIAKRPWERGREQALLENSNIAAAYARVTGCNEADAKGILDKYRSQYKVSIEDFAGQIKGWLDKKPADFRLNFFVDEIGQYIADNVKLMTNLQTIAESLATKCRGRAWVIVTAQEEINSIVGEMNKQQSNDFSKIQDRFKTRMKLTSADVAEVIQKRLLTKNEAGIMQISDVYHQESNNFKTLFDFADGSQTYRNFQDREHFIHCYPFIPYQFTLFQSAILSLSQHNAFEGKHSSVGERSMLGVFQQVAIQIGEHQLGQMATFDLMFEGIRTALKANIQQSILKAERNLDNKFAIKLLKTLFLVKYVREFKPTLRNLTVLMLDGFKRDLPALRKNIEEALNVLEQQSYIQFNGDLFEYLTDEEKDVELEIKNTEVEAADIQAELEKIIFDYVVKNRKIRHSDNSQDYSYSRKLDNRLHGREYELAINVVSPFHEQIGNEPFFRMQSMGSDELVVLMPADERLIRETMMYKKTEKYIKQNISITQQEAVKRILTDKGFQNRERYTDLQQLVKKLLGQASLFVAGTDIESSSEDAQTRINTGFCELVNRTYPNLRMLRGAVYSETDVSKHLKNQGLYDDNITSLPESEQEILAFIQSNNRGGVRTTMKNLIERFERKPYGWSYAAVLCTVASLWSRGKLEVRSDSNLLEDTELEKALRNTQQHPNLVLEPQIEFTASQVRSLKEFYEDFFDSPPQSNEAKALGKETCTAIQELKNQLLPLAAQVAQYPFLEALAQVVEKLKSFSNKPYTWFLTELPRMSDELLNLKEETIDPVRKFMSGPQKGIFDSARRFIQTQEPNFAYVEDEQASQVSIIIAAKDCYKGNKIQQLKALTDSLQEQIKEKLTGEIDKATLAVTELKDRLCSMSEFAALKPDQQKEIAAPFDEFCRTTASHKLIAVIRDNLRRFEENDYQKLLTRLTQLAQPAPEPPPAPTKPDKGKSTTKAGSDNKNVKEPEVEAATPPAPQPAPVEYINSRSISVPFSKAWLADRSDVDSYVESMRQALLAEIQKGKRIQI
ncbi:MAG: BREX system P-loop protein BrxC [Erysipelotrichia bacterium]|nr:BREX system P-loop protein BrxC [Erysipelotrichia bacterium]